MKLKGKVALVTGSSAGIGAAMAKGFAAAGADIVVNYRSDENGAKATEQAVRNCGCRCLVVRADVGKTDEVKRMFDEIESTFGRLDILVNNAGYAPKSSFSQIEEDDWDKLLATNLKSVFLCCKRALAIMPRGGSVLNISSVHSFVTQYNFSHYAATKAAMESLTRSLAIEYGECGIRVNALRVGWIVTEREPFGPEEPSYPAVCARIPIGRVGQVDDIVGPALLLCTEQAGFVTGAILNVDGGATAMLNAPFAKGFIEGGAIRD